MQNNLYIETLNAATVDVTIHTLQPGKYILLDLERSCAYRANASGELVRLGLAEYIAILDAELKFLTCDRDQ